MPITLTELAQQEAIAEDESRKMENSEAVTLSALAPDLSLAQEGGLIETVGNRMNFSRASVNYGPTKPSTSTSTNPNMSASTSTSARMTFYTCDIARAIESKNTSTDNNSAHDIKRTKILNEILATERAYISKLHILIDIFLDPIRKLKWNTPVTVFDELYEDVIRILEINRTFLSRLEGASSTNTVIVATTFKEYGSRFKLYCDYVTKYPERNQQVTKLMQAIPQVKTILANARVLLNARQERTPELKSYMIAPVQRLPRYTLLLKDLLKATDQSREDYIPIQRAIEEISFVNIFINERKREIENKQRVFDIQDKLRLKDLARPNRTFVSENEVLYMRENGKAYNAIQYLLNDLILFHVQFQFSTKTLRVDLRSASLTIGMSVDYHGLNTAILINDGSENIIVQFNSEQEAQAIFTSIEENRRFCRKRRRGAICRLSFRSNHDQ